MLLNVDDHVRRTGIPLVSKCNCCEKGGYEDINHVLATGEVASSIWERCAKQVGMPWRQFQSW